MASQDLLAALYFLVSFYKTTETFDCNSSSTWLGNNLHVHILSFPNQFAHYARAVESVGRFLSGWVLLKGLILLMLQGFWALCEEVVTVSTERMPSY